MTDGAAETALLRVATRAQQLIALHRPDEALRVLGPAIAEHPDSCDLLCLAAHAHLLRDEPWRAAQVAGRGAACDPAAEWPHRLQSIAYGAMGLFQESAASAHRSVQLAPPLYIAHVQYARALSRLPGPAAQTQAWAEGNRAVELAPHEPEVHLLMAQLAHPTTGTTVEGLAVAEAALRRTLELDPENSVALNDLGRLKLRRGQGVNAIVGFSDALSANPQNSAALHNVSVVLAGYLPSLHWVITVASFVSLGGCTPRYGPGGRIVQGVTALVLLTAVGGAVIRLRRRARRRLPTFLRVFARRNRVRALWGLVLLVIGFALVLVPVLPDDARIPTATWAVAIAALLTAYLVLRQIARNLQWLWREARR